MLMTQQYMIWIPEKLLLLLGPRSFFIWGWAEVFNSEK